MRDDDLQLSLVWQAKNGNAQALNALLDANKGKIYAAAYALLKNREDAEDAMQQALIAVWQNIGKLAAPEAFETWLYRVTYTRSLNILKSRKNNEMVIENDIGDMPQAALLESELMLPHEYAPPLSCPKHDPHRNRGAGKKERSEVLRLRGRRRSARKICCREYRQDDAVASGGSKNPICRAAGGVCGRSRGNDRRRRRSRRDSGHGRYLARRKNRYHRLLRGSDGDGTGSRRKAYRRQNKRAACFNGKRGERNRSRSARNRSSRANAGTDRTPKPRGIHSVFAGTASRGAGCARLRLAEVRISSGQRQQIGGVCRYY